MDKGVEQQWFWYVQWSEGIVAALFMCIVSIIHCNNVISDLYTATRKSLSHRQSLPQLNFRYKSVTWCTLISTLLFTIELVLEVIVGCRFQLKYCKIIITSLADIYFIAKLFMYFVFLIRLDMVYGSSMYAYNRTYLLIAGIIPSIVIFTAVILNPLTIKITPFIYNKFAVICHPSYNKYMLSSVIIADIIVSFGFIVAFLYPLAKNTNFMKQDNEHQTGTLIKIGVKALILTITANASSMIMMTLLMITPFSYFFIKLDMSANAISIILMTPYYNDEKYYSKICCGMIWCCNICGISNNDTTLNKVNIQISSHTSESPSEKTKITVSS